jgi:hypothetical protein
MKRLFTSLKGTCSFLHLQGERIALIVVYYYWSIIIALGNRFNSPEFNH